MPLHIYTNIMLKKKSKTTENRDEVVQKLISEFDESTVRGKISYIKFLLGHYVSSETFHHMSDFFNKDLIREMNGIIAGLHKVENVLKTKCKI